MIRRSEIAVPKSLGEFIFVLAFFSPAILGTVVSVLYIVLRVWFTLPCIWLAIMALGVILATKQQGDFRKLLINVLGFFSFKQLAESVELDNGSVEIRFGFQLAGRRQYYFTVPLAKIQEVEWSPNERWGIFMHYDHDDPEKSLKQQMLQKPDQDIYCVGSSMRVRKTEAFGLAFVDFLLQNGAKLERQDDHTFVRADINNG